MRYAVIVAGLILLVSLAAVDARGAGPRQGVQIINNNYVINGSGNYGPGSYGRNYGYGYGRGHGYGRGGFSSHDEAVARIQATHSPHRQTYHPRSFYNQPPVYYGW
ncbi:MAG: hypothetical protein ACYC6Y_04645 [Thermoguttaceae bacterium]